MTQILAGIAIHVCEQAERTLAAYRAQPNLIREHVGIEDEVLSGGYGHRQIHELIQNAADAILESGRPGRVQLILTPTALYCANEGAPIDSDGVDATLNSHISRKRGSQIGQFGIGFKSVLAISTCPEFHGSSGSFAFDGTWSEDKIRREVPGVDRTPVLRLARPLTEVDADDDPQLGELMSWATTVVKLPRDIERTGWLSTDFAAFPREFLLFSPHVQSLTLDDQVRHELREISTEHDRGMVLISESGSLEEWTVFSKNVGVGELGAEARQDADRKTRGRPELPLLWAVPRDRKRVRGRFWAFFPTETETTLSGILNAPWKTNADRQNLLDGPFNRAVLEQTGVSLA